MPELMFVDLVICFIFDQASRCKTNVFQFADPKTSKVLKVLNVGCFLEEWMQ